MAILEELVKKKGTDNIEGKESVTDSISDPIQLAVNTASVIGDGISQGTLSNANSILDHLAEDNKREECVFLPTKNIFYKTVFILAFFFLVLGISFSIISGIVIHYSETLKAMAGSLMVTFLILGVIDLLWIVSYLKENQYQKRYHTYYQLIKFKRIVLIEELADYSKTSSITTIQDIKKAINRNYIPQGYFSDENLFLITSNDVYKDYQENKATYNHYMNEKLEKYKRQSERPEEIQKYIDEGKRYIDKIHQDNDLIKDKDISTQLDQMEKTVSVIFEEFDVNPENADELALLLQYYLPTTEKLLQSYIHIDEQASGTGIAKNTKGEIIESLNNTNRAYERILEQLFKQEEIDFSSDIDALSEMMKQEGLLDNESGNAGMDQNGNSKT